jgi:methyl-accepting chemotaxis protein
MTHWFGNIRMTPKLIGSFILMALLACMVGISGLNGITSLQRSADLITGDTVPGLVQAQKISFDIAAAMTASRGTLIATDPTARPGLAVQAKQYREDALRQFTAFAAANADSGGAEGQHIAQSGKLLAQWATLNEQISAEGASGDSSKIYDATTLTNDNETSVIKPLTVSMTWLVTMLEQEAQSRAAQSRTTAGNATHEVIGVAVLAALLALFLGLFIARSVVRPLAQVESSAENLAKGWLTDLAASMQAFAHGDLPRR